MVLGRKERESLGASPLLETLIWGEFGEGVRTGGRFGQNRIAVLMNLESFYCYGNTNSSLTSLSSIPSPDLVIVCRR